MPCRHHQVPRLGQNSIACECGIVFDDYEAWAEHAEHSATDELWAAFHAKAESFRFLSGSHYVSMLLDFQERLEAFVDGAFDAVNHDEYEAAE
jgi:hypothetical protein